MKKIPTYNFRNRDLYRELRAIGLTHDACDQVLDWSETLNESLPIVSERPKFVKCSVTGLISVNQSGSSIGGGFWEYLYADEVAKLGINPKTTKNADMVEGGC